MTVGVIIIKKSTLVLVNLVIPFCLSAKGQELSSDEHLGYARSCYKVVKKLEACPEKTLPSDGRYLYSPSRIIETGYNGATIETKIKINYKCESGSNKGWGIPSTEELTNNFTCVSINVPRGGFPDPDIFLRQTDKNLFHLHIYTSWEPLNCAALRLWPDSAKPNEAYKEYSSHYDFNSLNTPDECWRTKSPGASIARKLFGKHLQNK